MTAFREDYEKQGSVRSQAIKWLTEAFNANYKGYHVGEGPGTPPRLTDSHVPGRCEWGMTGAGAAHVESERTTHASARAALCGARVPPAEGVSTKVIRFSQASPSGGW